MWSKRIRTKRRSRPLPLRHRLLLAAVKGLARPPIQQRRDKSVDKSRLTDKAISGDSRGHQRGNPSMNRAVVQTHCSSKQGAGKWAPRASAATAKKHASIAAMVAQQCSAAFGR